MSQAKKGQMGSTNNLEGDSLYVYIKQNPVINELIRIGPYNISKSDTPPSGCECSLERGILSIRKNSLSVFFQGYTALIEGRKAQGLRTSTYKLLDYISIMFNQHSNDQRIDFSLGEYMLLCGLKDKEEAKERINSDLETLKSISIRYDKALGKSEKYYNVNILDTFDIKRGLIKLCLSSQFSAMLEEAPVMPYPLPLLEVRQNDYPNAFYLLRRIMEHKNMNFGKANENVISAGTLINSCPSIPVIDKVRNTVNHSYYQRIITPFLRDLHEASAKVGVLNFEIIHKIVGRRDVIPEEKIKGLSYEDFVNNVLIKFPNLWPQYPSRREKKGG